MSADAADVFLSYASADGPTADAVVAALSTAGVRVWRDKTHIVGGARYKASIVAGLRAAKVVLLLCSPHSLVSENVAAELNMAWDDFGKKPVLQLWLVDRAGCPIPDELLMTLSLSRQYLRYHGRAEADWLNDTLKALATFGVTVELPPLNPAEAGSGKRADTEDWGYGLPADGGERDDLGAALDDPAPAPNEHIVGMEFELQVLEDWRPQVSRVLARRAEPILELWGEYAALLPEAYRPAAEQVTAEVSARLRRLEFVVVLLGPLAGQLVVTRELLGHDPGLPATATLPTHGLTYTPYLSLQAVLEFGTPSLDGPPPSDWPDDLRRHYTAAEPGAAVPNLAIQLWRLPEVLIDLPGDYGVGSPLTSAWVGASQFAAEFLRDEVELRLSVGPDRGDAFEHALAAADAVVYAADARISLGPREEQWLTRHVRGRGIWPCRTALVDHSHGVGRPRFPRSQSGRDRYHLPADRDSLAADLRRDAADRVNVKCRNALNRLLKHAEEVFGTKPKPAVATVLEAAREMLAELTPIGGGTP